MKNTPKKPFSSPSSFPYSDAFQDEASLKLNKKPSTRFSATSTRTGAVIAVIEAPDALIAYSRFMRVRHIILYKIDDLEILSIKEQHPGEPCHSAFFANGFFEMLAASDALKR